MSAAKPTSKAVPLIVTAVGLAAIAAWWRVAFRPSSPEPPPAVRPAPSAERSAPAPEVASAPKPAAPPRGAFVGRARCAECHDEESDAWTHDWHARALAWAAADTVVGRFNGVHYKGTSSEAWMRREQGAYHVRTAGPDGALETYDVTWVIGGKRMQDPVTVFADGRWQVLPVYYHVTGKGEWVDYNESKQGPIGPDHPFFWANFRRTANRECLDCHVTGLRVRYDRTTHAWSTSMTDAGVSCESCHGPGERHAETQDPDDIVQPRKAPPDVALSLCGQCHGPRNPLFPLLDEKHRFVAGERYGDHYQPHGMIHGGERSGDFFADGRPKSSSFEYQALVQSRCHLKGSATCVSCHTAPHAPHDPAEMRPPPDPAPKAPPERADASACKSCHAPVFAQGEDHTHHRDKAAQRCIACHMPPVVTGVLDTFVDHAIDVPVPENTARHGVPNACNVCHTKQSPEEMSRAIASLWPGAAARGERRRRLADAFDEATKDDSRAPLEAVIGDAEEAAELRATAALLLAKRFPARAMAAIKPLLGSPDSLLRAKAAEALGAAGAKAAAGDLAPLGRDPSPFVREAAALALAGLGDARAEGALRALTTDPATEGLPRPHGMLALSLVRHNAIQPAVAELERAIDLQPYYVDAMLLLADIEARNDRFDRTRALVEEVLRFDPQHPGARKRLQLLEGGR